MHSVRIVLPPGANGITDYSIQLKQLDDELEDICNAFHANETPVGRPDHLYATAEAKQRSVTSILTRILNDKKASLPFLLTQDHRPRPPGLRIALLDGSAESLSTAARLANKPFKLALRAMLTELNMSIERGERGRLIMGPVKRLAGIAEKMKRGATNIFDLNRATIVFENEAELRAILEALPRFFEVVYLDNKFKKQWEEATQPPCLHLNLRMRPELLPPELTAMLAAGADGWVVELQLHMRDFLDVKHRCHAIYEITRLRVVCGEKARANEGARVEGECKTSAAGAHVAADAAAAAATHTQYRMLPLPRACPKCGLLRHFIKSSQLHNLKDMSFGQKLVKKAFLSTMDGETKQELEVAYNLVAINEKCRLLEDVFIREVSLLARLEHPNVLQILGLVREEKSLGFVTEWIPQGSLWKCLQNPQERQQLDVWAVAFQLCDALLYVHSHGVVHFDMKSNNVLLARDSDGSLVAKLCDFGLSKEVNESTLRSRVGVGGTPNWQAPETWDGVDSFHPSADVYAFGGVLIELFGKPGCFPWEKHLNKNEIKRQVKEHRGKPPELASVEDEKVKALITDCLAYDSGSRPTMKKIKARLLAAHVDSLSFDSDARRVLVAMADGTLSFPELFAELRGAHPETWPATVSFFEKYWKASPRFEVALAMCYFFGNKNNDTNSYYNNNDDNNNTRVNSSVGELSSLSLFEVCKRHMDEVVAAKFLAGWCNSHGTGGASRDEERAMRYYGQAAAQGYPAAQFQLGMFHQNLEPQQQNSEGEAVRWLTKAANQGHAQAQLSLTRYCQLEDSKGVSAVIVVDGDSGQEIRREVTVVVRRSRHADWAQEQVRLGVCYYNGSEDLQQDFTEAARLFRCAADQGYAQAQINLGMCYSFGRGVDQDMTEAARLFQLAANQGHAHAQYSLGVCYDKGQGVQQEDVTEAVRLYRLAADQGDAHAQLTLGVSYHLGIRGVQQDFTEAVRLLRLAVDQGNAEAQFNLGVCYRNGEGVEQDQTEAARLFQLAADQGHSRGQYALGLGQQEAVEAVRWFRLAANQGDAQAQFNLGLCYHNGQGVQQDDIEAARLFRLAADQGDVRAQFNLGEWYNNGQGVQRDLTEAARRFRLAADQGHVQAQYNLGLAYYSAQGLAQDFMEAARLFRLAADKGNVQAQAKLGLCYRNGQGVQQDNVEAARLLRLAADQGDAQAQYSLGTCYDNAHGVQHDETEAARFFRLAADQGHAQAQHSLALCFHSGRGVRRDAAEAVRFFRMAADQGHARAQSNLGACYFNGEGVQQDVTEAARLFGLAAGHRPGSA